MKEQFSHYKKLFLHYYIATAIAALLFRLAARHEAIIDPTILTILAIYLLAFPVVILFTRRYAVHIFLFLLAFITGFYSFYYYSVEPHSILNALYFTFQLYILELPDVFTSDGSSLLHYPLIVEIARWSAASYTIATLFIAIYRMLEMSILLILYQAFGRHIIVFGYNENSLAFIEDLRKKKKRVILITNHIPNEAVDYLEKLKVVVLYHHNNEKSIYTKSGISRANHVVLFHEKDVDNLNELMDIRYHFKKHSLKRKKLTIHVHLQEITSRKLFLDLKGTTLDQTDHFKVRRINLYELFVDALFEKHPIYTSAPEDPPVHLLIIGFGPLGQHIALEAMIQSKQFQKTPPFITALDKAMPKIEQDWQRNYGKETAQASISFQSFDVTTESVETVIRKQSTPITHIYVCLHQDHLDLWTGIALSSEFPHIPIYLEFSEGSIAEKWIDSEVSGTRLIYSIGTFKEILTEDRLFQKNR